MIKYDYNKDLTALSMAALHREDLEELIHGAMQFTADIVGLARDNYDDFRNAGTAIVEYLEDTGMIENKRVL